MQDTEMTIYYRKANGEIKQLMSGVNDMSVFGEEQEDFGLIWDYIVVEYDEYVRDNVRHFYVDVETKSLVFNAPKIPSKYTLK